MIPFMITTRTTTRTLTRTSTWLPVSCATSNHSPSHVSQVTPT